MFLKSLRRNYNIINVSLYKATVRAKYFINLSLYISYRALIAYNWHAKGLLALICNYGQTVLILWLYALLIKEESIIDNGDILITGYGSYNIAL